MTSRAPNAPLVLVIRDGWGENPNSSHAPFNAVTLADTPVDDQLRRDWPMTLIRTCGEAVGLPPGTMGNSEVGHQNIGAGRIVDQELMRITRAVQDESFFSNPVLVQAMQRQVQRDRGSVHLLGLVSDGQVHSDIEHLFALIELARRLGVPHEQLFVHVITDGRDVGPTTSLGFIRQLDDALRAAGIGTIATVTGRYYAMDRDHRWQRTKAAYDALTGRGAVAQAETAVAAVERYYANPTDPSMNGDEFIVPTIIGDAERGRIRDGDSVIFFNFRGDRPRQLTRAFTLDDPQWASVQGDGFDRGPRLDDVHFVTMSGYEQGLPVSAIAFEKPPKMPDILGQVVSDAGLDQFRCAETEKFAHVTFFFNDYREEPFAIERRVLVPSPQDVSTYDQKPEMSAAGVRDAVLDELNGRHDNSPATLIVVNFANPDMVGHTGNLEAVIKAVQTVDACVGTIVEATLARGGSLIVTADHGNAEQMYNPQTDSPHTAHTVYDVPLFIVGKAFANASLRSGGILGDIAPTALEMLDIPQPPAMTGRSLLAD